MTAELPGQKRHRLMVGCKVAGGRGKEGFLMSEGFSCEEKEGGGMRGFHCLMSGMPVESGDEVTKSLELQQQQTIGCRDWIHLVVITPQP